MGRRRPGDAVAGSFQPKKYTHRRVKEVPSNSGVATVSSDVASHQAPELGPMGATSRVSYKES